jgi:DNA-binding transcriptional ArsR family regulator
MGTFNRKQRDMVFKAIADPTRREIVGLLTRVRHTVGEIAGNFRTSRPANSKHLRLLRDAGLVVSRRKGTANICELNGKPLRAVNDWLRNYQAFWGINTRNLAIKLAAPIVFTSLAVASWALRPPTRGLEGPSI